jgi:transcriptional regulator with PAS, ATPase and Fis domain
VGGNVPIQTDVRIITATNTSLEDEVAKQNFREDLYYRINVVSFTIPPLRDRLSDIEPLATHFIDRFNKIHHKEIKGITKSALQYCLQYPWPGNVRELENVIERAVILSPGEFIVPESLPAKITDSKPILSKECFKDMTLEDALDRAEKQILLDTLDSFSWNRQLSAKALGISRTTLFNKMRRFQMMDPRRSSPDSLTKSPSP